MAENLTDKRQELDATAMAILVVASASWGLQQVAIKVANSGISPVMQSAVRSFGAAILLWLWMFARREPLFEKDGTLRWGITAGVLFAGEFLLIFWGLTYTSASRAVIFLYTSPFVVALGAQIFIPSERLHITQVIGLCCAFVGVVAAFSESLNLPSYRMLIGDAMLVGAAVFWGATTVLVKASPLSRISPAKTLLYQLVVSFFVLLLWSRAMNEPGIIKLTPLIIACVIYQIVWVAFITYLAWFWLIRKYPASRIASFTFLAPLFGVLAGGVLLNEPLTGILILSLILVGAGIYLVNRPSAK